MRNINEAIREKEQQVRVLMEQIDKLRAAAQILEEEENPLGVVVDDATIAAAKPMDNAPAVKRAWP